MKKMNWTTLALAVLPLMMVFVASDPSGVTVFDGTTTTTMSWYQTVPESPLGWCAPMAGLLNYVLFGAAVLYAVSKKRWCLQTIFGVALAAVCIVVLPVVAQPEIKIVPNVMGSILLAAECVVAYFVLKKPEDTKEKKKNGKRLESR